jgi:hypothetical protein
VEWKFARAPRIDDWELELWGEKPEVKSVAIMLSCPARSVKYLRQSNGRNLFSTCVTLDPHSWAMEAQLPAASIENNRFAGGKTGTVGAQDCMWGAVFAAPDPPKVPVCRNFHPWRHRRVLIYWETQRGSTSSVPPQNFLSDQ